MMVKRMMAGTVKVGNAALVKGRISMVPGHKYMGAVMIMPHNSTGKTSSKLLKGSKIWLKILAVLEGFDTDTY